MSILLRINRKTKLPSLYSSIFWQSRKSLSSCKANLKKEKQENLIKASEERESPKNELKNSSKIKDVNKLMNKDKLSLAVTISGVAGYVAVNPVSILPFIGLPIGIFLCAGSANSLNQLKEVQLDSQRAKTRTRPIVTGKMSYSEAFKISSVSGLAGFSVLLATCGLPTATLGLFNIFLYSNIYTNMKRESAYNTSVGAIVGFIPPIMGASVGLGFKAVLDPGALAIGAILFLWQHPHFYGLSYKNKDDYYKAGYKMMPKESLKHAQYVSLLSSLLLWPSCIALTAFGYTGVTFLAISSIMNCEGTRRSWKFWKKANNETADGMFFFSLGFIIIICCLVGLDIFIEHVRTKLGI